MQSFDTLVRAVPRSSASSRCGCYFLDGLNLESEDFPWHLCSTAATMTVPYNLTLADALQVQVELKSLGSGGRFDVNISEHQIGTTANLINFNMSVWF